eukprot:4770655-Pyramimonas_sp.AAC.1
MCASSRASSTKGRENIPVADTNHRRGENIPIALAPGCVPARGRRARRGPPPPPLAPPARGGRR